MTFNNEVFHKTSAEVNTQVAIYFDVVDNAITMSKTNNKYVIDAQASYSPSAPIHAGSFTTFIISPACDNTTDLYNGFIKETLMINALLSASVNARFDKLGDHAFNVLWVGCKDAMDVVEKHEILANSISIYTQNFGPEESFITACGAFTITPRFVDSIIFLFPLTPVHHTVFKNPIFKNFQLRCGGYGVVPTIPLATDGSDPMFIELCQNAMNINGEQKGFNKEVIQSLTNIDNCNITNGNISYDRTSFFIGLPTETDNTFQQATKVDPSAGSNNYFKNKTPPFMALLQDTVISIHVQPNGMPPVVEIDQYNIHSIVQFANK
ncbi:hypothetical protein M9Y10_000681 [Tritrichomonas musculus]|uniref:Uncharacterized protein n=1 Tax=Tritrichomonas musculus TaxID=1915356 RepID=A0ABR2L5X2_9EUKA